MNLIGSCCDVVEEGKGEEGKLRGAKYIIPLRAAAPGTLFCLARVLIPHWVLAATASGRHDGAIQFMGQPVNWQDRTGLDWAGQDRTGPDICWEKGDGVRLNGSSVYGSMERRKRAFYSTYYYAYMSSSQGYFAIRGRNTNYSIFDINCFCLQHSSAPPPGTCQRVIHPSIQVCVPSGGALEWRVSLQQIPGTLAYHRISCLHVKSSRSVIWSHSPRKAASRAWLHEVCTRLESTQG